MTPGLTRREEVRLTVPAPACVGFERSLAPDRPALHYEVCNFFLAPPHVVGDERLRIRVHIVGEARRMSVEHKRRSSSGRIVKEVWPIRTVDAQLLGLVPALVTHVAGLTMPSSVLDVLVPPSLIERSPVEVLDSARPDGDLRYHRSSYLLGRRRVTIDRRFVPGLFPDERCIVELKGRGLDDLLELAQRRGGKDLPASKYALLKGATSGD